MKEEVIGNCRLILGDCREVIPTLIGIDSIVTDPPYGMGFQSNHRTDKHIKIANDESVDLLIYACSIKPSHSSYIFCRWDNLFDDIEKPKSLITWVKNNWSMGDLEHEHARQTEVALFYKGENHKWVGKRPSDVVMASRTGNNEHPTEKPVYLMEQFVMFTDGNVLDPFMGSGTTGVACVNMNRPFTGIEIEQKYFDIACRRIDDAYKQQRLFA